MSSRNIFFQVHVWKTAIIKMNGKLLLGKSATWKQGTNRFEDDSMLRFDKNMSVQCSDKFSSLADCPGLFDQRAEDLDFHDRQCRALHKELTAQKNFSSCQTILRKYSEVLAGILFQLY